MGLQKAKIVWNDQGGWVCCPKCNKRAFPIDNKSVIKNLSYQCRFSHCKTKFLVNVEPESQLSN